MTACRLSMFQLQVKAILIESRFSTYHARFMRFKMELNGNNVNYYLMVLRTSQTTKTLIKISIISMIGGCQRNFNKSLVSLFQTQKKESKLSCNQSVSYLFYQPTLNVPILHQTENRSDLIHMLRSITQDVYQMRIQCSN